jgi:DNA-binding NtrC family response regulator
MMHSQDRLSPAADKAIPNLIGQSAVFRRALELIRRIAGFDVPVLLKGETGTGKELAARAIHYLSVRHNAPFVPLNCGSLPDALAESELFGCEPGAFTDARSRRSGIISAAEGGTLFLDEIDSLAARAQSSLLRFLQDRTYRPLGATRERIADVRIVAAAGPAFSTLVESGAFRADLAYRLDVVAIEMPPLRERKGDVLLLANHFSRRFARQHGLEPRPIEGSSARWLDRYHWPGNVRELENLVLRQTLLCTGKEIALADAADAADGAPRALSLYGAARQAALCAWEHGYLCQLLARAGGNVTQAAKLAGKERRALGKLIKKHGLDRSAYSPHGSG